MITRKPQQLSVAGFVGLAGLSLALAVFIHTVSPLRDPTFERNSGNAGTPVPWLAWIPESAWLWGSFGLAALLALSLTWVFYHWSQSTLSPSSQRPELVEQVWRARWVGMTTVLMGALWFTVYVLVNVVYPFSRQGYGVQVTTTLITTLLAVNFTGMIWFWRRIQPLLSLSSGPDKVLQRWGQLFTAVYWFGFCASVFTALQMVFLLYLFAQHIVD
ncbi:MAG: hypothetical protein HC929_14460 [Leptolyngbyaceae cyanobacterium SM2_5_2]|nr:hypothetical protein [Leptolyngbyaceae cyanobacterium SM2_5_2]